ncbi:unnamed protein product [Blumeria hordei]|uniref:Mitochondrial ATP synthase epsilon chain domain-containing protein n=1 Tax=Blumeria hordei TaxID=2867405 RepID=A0A383UZH4_BLUHO|nr:unnamed protein product [Blumeria hordei]
MAFAWKASGLSYNKYLSVVAQALRNCLKDDVKMSAERRGALQLKFAKWENGKQGEFRSVSDTTTTGTSSSM